MTAGTAAGNMQKLKCAGSRLLAFIADSDSKLVVFVVSESSWQRLSRPDTVS